jgi:ABC-type dipeptide/oligopeptide/nickel transport system permease component
MTATLPLKNARLVSLTLAWCLGVIGGSVGINSIVKRNQQVADLKRTVYPIRLWVNTFDLINSGIVLAVGCGVLSVVCSIWIGLILLDSRKRTIDGSHPRTPLSTRLLKFEWMSLAFMDIWIFACVIPVTYIGRTGSAHVRAFLNGNELPAAVVAATQSRLGVKSDYWHNYSVKLQVIPPWFTLLFGVIAAAISFTAARKAPTATETYNTGESPTTTDEKAVEHHDHAESGRPADSPIEKKETV